MQQYRLSDNWLESSSAESIGALGILVDKLSMNTWVALMVRKANCTAVQECSWQVEGSHSLLFSTCETRFVVLCSVWGLPSTRKPLMYFHESGGGP